MSSSRDWLEKIGKPVEKITKEEAQYNEENLKGIKVEHALEDFEAGTSTILVAQDVDVLDDDEDDEDAGGIKLVEPLMASKPKVDQSKLTFSFEEEEAEEEAEPKFFVIGDEKMVQRAAAVQEDVAKRAQFDQNYNSTIETISFSTSKASKKRSVRKKEFSTEGLTFKPEIINHAMEEDADDVEDDLDLSKAVAEARKKNMELIRKRMLEEHSEDEMDVDNNIASHETGKSFSALKTETMDIDDEELDTFDSFLAAKSENKAEETPVEEPSLEVEKTKSKFDFTQIPDRDFSKSEDLIGEPLASSSLGVGKAIALLKCRGYQLKLIDPKDKDSRSNNVQVKLEYYDEFGNVISAKEAYKQLSHRFHGNQSGKNKEEKRLQKIEERKKGKGGRNMDGRGDGGNKSQPKKEAPKPTTSNAKPKTSQAAAPKKKPKIFGML